MILKKLFILIIVSSFFQCQSQESDVYLIIDNIYNDKGSPLIGVKGVKYLNAQDLFENQFHLIKNGNNLKFIRPDSIQVNIDSLKDFGQVGVIDSGKFLSIKEAALNNKTFTIKYTQDFILFPDSEFYIMSFKIVDKKEFYNSLKNIEIEQIRIAEDIEKLKNRLVKSNPIEIVEPSKKSTFKKETIFDSDNSNIYIKIPSDVSIKKSGALQTDYFDNIKIGTFLPNSKIYDFYYGEDFIYDQVSVYVSSDSTSFSINDYVANDKSIKVVKKDYNNIYGYRAIYNKIGKDILCSFFILKYYKLNSSHVFIYYSTSNVPESYLNTKNDIANYNYYIIQNIEVSD